MWRVLCPWQELFRPRRTRANHPSLLTDVHRFVAVGPYRWVRNPIYIAALFVAGGEAWLFLSLPLLAYTAAAAVCFHGFVVWYEEPRLRRQFGDEYEAYRRSVSRWLPRPP